MDVQGGIGIVMGRTRRIRTDQELIMKRFVTIRSFRKIRVLIFFSVEPSASVRNRRLGRSGKPRTGFALSPSRPFIADGGATGLSR